MLDRRGRWASNGRMEENAAITIRRLNAALAQDFRLMPLEYGDAPVFLAVALPVAEGVTGLKPRLPAGRGLRPQQALLSAGAEAVELRASLAMHHLPALAALPRRDGLAMLAATDLQSGASVALPAQSVFLDCAAVLGEPLVTDACSTGCAAGATPEQARQAALWECIERDAVALWWHGGAAPGPLPLELIDPAQPRLFWWLEQRARSTRLLDLTSDIGLPVVAAVSADADGRSVAVGTAARPDRAAAALAAVTEMIQTEAGMAQARTMADPELLHWEASASLAGQPQFRVAEDRRQPDPLPDAAALLQRLAALGHRALGVEMTLPGDPLPSARVLVPGLCMMGGRVDTPRFHARRRTCGPTFPEPY